MRVHSGLYLYYVFSPSLLPSLPASVPPPSLCSFLLSLLKDRVSLCNSGLVAQANLELLNLLPETLEC